MPQSQHLHLRLCRVAQAWLSSTLFLMLGLAWLPPVALAADRTSPQINPQLQRPQDIPLERLERPLRTPPVSMKPVNLNTGSIEQLVTLPGITATVAQEIIEGRPYYSKTDLVQRHILSDAGYGRIEHLITAE